MITGAFRFDPAKVFAEMDEIRAWLEANDVPVQDVPVNARVEFADGLMTVDVYLRNEAGLKYFIPGTETIARSTVTVPLLVEPPDFRSLHPLGASDA